MISSTQPITGELLALGRFDKEIEEYLEHKKHLSQRTINEEDVPDLVEALRIWLVKNVGCFNIIGEHHVVVNLSLWYDYDALTEEFDELLLVFRDWLNGTFSIETNKPHNLLRFVRSDCFYMFDGELPEELAMPEVEPEVDHDVEEVVGYLEEFEGRLQDNVSHFLDVKQFLEHVLPTTQRRDIIKQFII